MNRAKWVKATASQIAKYAESNPVYPLCAWIVYNGNKFAVEQCGNQSTYPGRDPVYEVMCLPGLMFVPDGTHTLLGWTQKDCLGRVESNSLETSTDTIDAGHGA